MFVSLPEYKFHVPAPLASPGATYWRSLGLSTNTPWYVLSVRPNQPDAAVDTFLLAWDADLVDAIRTSDVTVEALLLVKRDGDRLAWTPIEIVEIWEATDSEDEACRALLVDARGREYSGFAMLHVDTARRTRLVARMQPLAPQNAAAGC